MAYNAENQIIGLIRIMKWDKKDLLPVQKIFNINPLVAVEFIKEQSAVWHIGRFAVSSFKKIPGILLFKQLSAYALAPLYENHSDIVIAECDSKLIRVLSALGITFNILGRSIFYLGSETIPVFLTHSGVKDFFERHEWLLNQSNNRKLND